MSGDTRCKMLNLNSCGYSLALRLLIRIEEIRPLGGEPGEYSPKLRFAGSVAHDYDVLGIDILSGQKIIEIHDLSADLFLIAQAVTESDDENELVSLAHQLRVALAHQLRVALNCARHWLPPFFLQFYTSQVLTATGVAGM